MEIVKKCGYCLREYEEKEIKEIELTPDGGRTWLKQPILSCKSCRGYLHGNFRYKKRKR